MMNTQQETIRIKNMLSKCCIRVLRDEFEKRNVVVDDISIGRATISFNPEEFNFDKLRLLLEELEMSLISGRDEGIVENIKTVVIELVHLMNNADSIVRKSEYLVERLGINYQTMSKLFSKYEPVTLERYIILQKMEKIKELIDSEEYTLSEIAYMMDYSSVHYLSNQFKKINGLSVTDYKNSNGESRKPLDDLY